MNRRSFIKRASLLIGLSVINPVEFTKVVPKVFSRPLSWKAMILKLYPTKREAPLMAMLKKMKPTEDPKYTWWTK